VTLTHLYAGKVRDVYDAGEGRLLLVASDRISAFDVVLAEPIPDKGRILTALSAFWFDQMGDLAPSHLISIDPADFPDEAATLPDLEGRAMLVRRAEMLPIECIVRGYLAGSAWREYQASGTVHGVSLPVGLRKSDRLPEPIFTPSTKATGGGHDENITIDQAAQLVGVEIAKRAEEISLAVYQRAAERAAERGLIIADTKFELGFIDGELALCDEVLTSDSSRFWDAVSYQPGITPTEFDKQPVRDWLESTGWEKRPPPPPLPPEVIAATRQRYVEAYERLSGSRWR
jgi:phosphoribosylaminoimidazole-succinocarboxamide synthase